MRKSMEELLEKAFDIKCHLALGSYELHHYDDGSYVDFRPNCINDPRTLCLLAGVLTLRILNIEDRIVVRLFENFKEY